MTDTAKILAYASLASLLPLADVMSGVAVLRDLLELPAAPLLRFLNMTGAVDVDCTDVSSAVSAIAKVAG